MKANWFHNAEHIDWTRMWFVVGVATALWAGLAGLTVVWPEFDKAYKIINIIMGAVSGAVLFAARGTKYVANRQEPPADGKP